MSYVNLWTAWPGFLSPKKIPETRSRDFCPTKETSCVTRNTEALLFGRIFCGLGALGGSDQWTLERKLPTYISLLSITGIPESPSHEPGIPHPFGSSHSPRKKSFRGKSLGRLATPATSFWGLCWATYIRAIHIIPSFLSFPTSIIKDFVNFCNSQFVWYVCKCWGNLPWWLYIYIYTWLKKYLNHDLPQNTCGIHRAPPKSHTKLYHLNQWIPEIKVRTCCCSNIFRH